MDPRNYHPNQRPRVITRFTDPRSAMSAPTIRTRRRTEKTVRNENLTVNGQISKDGGILSHADGRMHTTKTSYMESLKRKGLVIKD